MTACAESRSVFDLCPDDEAFIGLRKVNNVQKEAVNSTDGVYEAVVSVGKTNVLCIFICFLKPFLVCSSTQSWKINPQRMTDSGSPAWLERCRTKWCVQPADAPLPIVRNR